MIRFFIHFIIIITVLISLIVAAFSPQQVELGYDLIWLHPLIFLLVYLVFFIPLLNLGQYKITLYSFVILSWVRFVMIPYGSSLTGIYNGVPYIYVGEDSIQFAIILIAYELLITSLFLYILIITNMRRGLRIGSSYLNYNLSLKGNKHIYAFFIIVAIILYLVLGRNMNLIQLFLISADTGERQGDLDSTWLVLLRQILITSFIFIFVWFVSFCKKMYDLTGKKAYVNYAIILAILNIGVIVGERRTAQLYTALIVMFILVYAFKKYRKRIISIISISALTVLIFMSIYKHFAAFAHGSYVTAVSSSNFDLEFITITLQSYFFGTQNVATVFELNKYTELSFINFLFDFGRSIFGLSFFLKDKMVMTSQIFNSFIYGQSVATGHVLSGLGFGYLYLGIILSPIIVCLNIFISTKLEWLLNKTNSFEMKYIIGYILVRFSTNLFASTPPLISLATIMLFTAGLLYYFALLMNRKHTIRSLIR